MPDVERRYIKMKGIQVWNEELGQWEWCQGYVAMKDADAKDKIKMLRAWAKADKSSAKYRIRSGEIVPA